MCTMHSMSFDTWMYEHTPIARTGLALCCRVILDSVAHGWVMAGHSRYTRAPCGEEAVGGPIMHRAIVDASPRHLSSDACGYAVSTSNSSRRSQIMFFDEHVDVVSNSVTHVGFNVIHSFTFSRVSVWLLHSSHCVVSLLPDIF